MFDEVFWVLKKGGCAVLSDIVSDDDVPDEMQTIPSFGAAAFPPRLTEEGFVAAFENARLDCNATTETSRKCCDGGSCC